MPETLSAPRPAPQPPARVCRGVRSDDLVARAAARKRDVLLRCYRHALSREDLEDAYSQAVLEILVTARHRHYDGERHVANAIEQRLRARIADRRRALGGRSPIEAALAGSVPVDEIPDGGLADTRADVPATVVALDELRRMGQLRHRLTTDQQAVLVNEASGGRSDEFTATHGWSAEKYRKVAQRGRRRLQELLAASAAGPAPADRSLAPAPARATGSAAVLASACP